MADEIDWAELARGSYGVPEALAGRLERRLRDGSLGPGAKLPPERELAEQLGVSRASVREAMHELVLKGLLSRKPGTGTIVLEPARQVNDLLGNLDRTTRDRREVADFRLVFEPQIAELAAERATASNLEELDQLCAMDAATLSAERSVELDERFHSGLSHATHNTLLMALTTLTSAWLHEARLEAQRPIDVRQTSWAQHRAIVSALRRHDGPAARIEMAGHIRTFAVNSEATGTP
jgi:GntR family transcriptional repressor for pyruvate dehydrogenase complex